MCTGPEFRGKPRVEKRIKDHIPWSNVHHLGLPCSDGDVRLVSLSGRVRPWRQSRLPMFCTVTDSGFIPLEMSDLLPNHPSGAD